MKLELLHALPGRLSLKVGEPLRLPVAAALEESLRRISGVTWIELRRRARRLAIGHDGARETVTAVWAALRLELPAARGGPSSIPHGSWHVAARESTPSLRGATLAFLASQLLWGPLAVVITWCGAYPYLKKGLASLFAPKLGATVLDGLAIGAALSTSNYRAAGLISYLLTLGTHVERLTQRRSEASLAELLSRDRSKVWRIRGGNELETDRRDLQLGDVVVLRPGYVVPADGDVTEGAAVVNQAIVTGDAWPEEVTPGSHVYEGGVIVEGRILARVSTASDETRLAQMIRIIEETKHDKAAFESYAEKLADATVPYVLAGAGLAYLFTGDPLRAVASLLVDYSCALKLIVPMVFRTGVMQAGNESILVKGAKWLERLSRADALAFDKTGTLTRGFPTVIEVLPLNGYSTEYLLRNVACVEEHFSHPIASAIVEAARQAGLDHVVETHGPLEYLVSYGIISSVEGKRFIVGGERVLERHGIRTTLHGEEIRRRQRAGYRLVFVAVEQELAGIITLDDELHGEARRAISALKRLGMRKILMLTGDNEANARRIADALNLEEYHADLFPEQKVEILRGLKQEGYSVAMLGDGLNDGPALSCADVGISVSSGADLSRQVADVVLLAPTLDLVPEAILVSRATVARARRNFGYIVGINTTLLALGMLGWLRPTRLAFLHNMSTVLLTLNAARRPGVATGGRREQLTSGGGSAGRIEITGAKSRAAPRSRCAEDLDAAHGSRRPSRARPPI